MTQEPAEEKPLQARASSLNEACAEGSFSSMRDHDCLELCRHLKAALDLKLQTIQNGSSRHCPTAKWQPWSVLPAMFRTL